MQYSSHSKFWKNISTVQGEISISNQNIKSVNSFVYLWSVIPNSTDVIRRTALAAQAFGRLKEVIWKNRNIVFPLKVSLILPIATYASETETSQKRTTGLLTLSRWDVFDACLWCMSVNLRWYLKRWNQNKTRRQKTNSWCDPT